MSNKNEKLLDLPENKIEKIYTEKAMRVEESKENPFEVSDDSLDSYDPSRQSDRIIRFPGAILESFCIAHRLRFPLKIKIHDMLDAEDMNGLLTVFIEGNNEDEDIEHAGAAIAALASLSVTHLETVAASRCVPTLLGLLTNTDSYRQELTLLLLSILAPKKGFIDKFIMAGGQKLLVEKILSTENVLVRQQVLSILVRVPITADEFQLVLCSDAMLSVIFLMLLDTETSQTTQEDILTIVASICKNYKVRTYLASTDVISALMKHLMSSSRVSQARCVDIFHEMICDTDTKFQKMIIIAGVIKPLVQLFVSHIATSGMFEKVTTLLFNMYESISADGDDIFEQDDAATNISKVLTEGSVNAKIVAMKVMCDRPIREVIKEKLLANGVVPGIITSFRNFNDAGKEAAAKTVLQLLRTASGERIELTGLMQPQLQPQSIQESSIDSSIFHEITSWLLDPSDVVKLTGLRILGRMCKDQDMTKGSDRRAAIDMFMSTAIAFLANLDDCDEYTQEHVTMALADTSRFPIYARRLYRANVIGQLISLLTATSKNVVTFAMRTIFNVAKCFEEQKDECDKYTDINSADRLNERQFFLKDINRFIPSLIALLSTGSDNAMEYAVEVLHDISLDSGTNNCFAIADSGGIPLLSTLLRVGTIVMRNHCVGILRNLTEISTYVPLIIASHVTPSLVEMLTSSSQLVVNDSCVILRRIFVFNKHSEGVNVKVLVQYLLEIISNSKEPICTPAVDLLGLVLESDSSHCELVVTSGTHVTIMNLLTDSTICESASKILTSLSTVTELTVPLVEADIIQSLMVILQTDECSDFTPTAQANVITILINLAAAGKKQEIMSAGVVVPLVSLLRTSPVEVKEKVVMALNQLSDFPEARDLMVKLHIIVLLVILLKEGTSLIIDEAVSALHNIAAVIPYRVLMKEAGILVIICDLTNQEYSPGTRRHALGILQFLSTDIPGIVETLNDEDEDGFRDDDALDTVSFATLTCDLIMAQIGLPRLLSFFGTEIDDRVCDHIAAIICNILSDDAYFKQISSPQVLSPLIQNLYRRPNSSVVSTYSTYEDCSIAQEFILEALWTIIFNGFDTKLLLQCGLLEAVSFSLSQGTNVAKEKSALIIEVLSVNDNITFSVDIIQTLINALKGSSEELLSRIMSALRAVSITDSSLTVLRKESNIKTIKRAILDSEDEDVIEDGAGLLLNISRKVTKWESSYHIHRIISPDLLSLFVSCVHSSEGASHACISEIILLLTADESNRGLLMDASVPAILMDNLASEEDEVAKNSIDSLCNIIQKCTTKEKLRKGVKPRSISKSGLKGVVSIVIKNSGMNEDVNSGRLQRNALELLCKICVNDATAAEALMSLDEDPITPLLPLLEYGTASVKLSLTGILSKLLSYSRKARDMFMKDPLALESLVGSLTGKTLKKPEYAARILYELSMDEPNRPRLCTSEVFHILVDMLHTQNANQVRADAAGTLYFLSRGGPKDRIGEAGAIPPLVYMFREEKGEMKQSAQWALQKLAKVSANRDELKALGITKDAIDYNGFFW